MKVFVIAHRSETHKPEEFAPLLGPEANHALGLYRDEKIREIYSRDDGKGAILVVEAATVDEARDIVGTLPLAQKGMLTFEIYGARPYRGIVANIT